MHTYNRDTVVIEEYSCGSLTPEGWERCRRGESASDENSYVMFVEAACHPVVRVIVAKTFLIISVGGSLELNSWRIAMSILSFFACSCALR